MRGGLPGGTCAAHVAAAIGPSALQHPTIPTPALLVRQKGGKHRERARQLPPAVAAIQLTLHLALGVDNDAGIVLKVDEGAVLSPPRLALPHHHGRMHCTQSQSACHPCPTAMQAAQSAGNGPAALARVQHASCCTWAANTHAALLHVIRMFRDASSSTAGCAHQMPTVAQESCCFCCHCLLC